MPTPLQQSSLNALLSGGSNIANSRVALRNTQLEDPRTSDAFRRLVMGENAVEEADQNADPINQRYEAISAGQNAAAVNNVPEIAKLHAQQLAEKEQLATAPARTAGMYNVQAAQAAGKERALLAEENRQALEGRQAQTQQNISTRQGATQRSLFDRQRVAGLQKGTIKAQTPQPNGLMDSIQNFFGLGKFDQGNANQAEIARLQGGGGGGQEQADDFSNAQPGDRAETAEGIQIVFDGQQWVPAN